MDQDDIGPMSVAESGQRWATGPNGQVGRDAERHLIGMLIPLLLFRGYAQMANSGLAAGYSSEFGLDGPALARMFGWIALGSFGAAALGRAMDRIGRRSLLLLGVGGFTMAAAATAAAPTALFLTVSQIVMGTFAGAMGTSTNVILNEALSDETRARGHAIAGIIYQVGSGVGLIAAALAGSASGEWRWVWGVCALMGLSLPALTRKFPETARFHAARTRRETVEGRMTELFSRRYRSRAVGMLMTSALMNLTSFSTMTWLLYHPETARGLSPALVTAVVVAGGGVGLLGFPIGARFANRWGRGPTVLAFGLAFSGANTAYYWLPPLPGLLTPMGMLVAFSLGSICFGASSIGLRTAMGELFPTRLRGTLSGAMIISASISMMLAHFATAWLTGQLGDLVLAITLVAAIGASGFVLYPLLVPETVDTGLEESPLPSV